MALVYQDTRLGDKSKSDLSLILISTNFSGAKNFLKTVFERLGHRCSRVGHIEFQAKLTFHLQGLSVKMKV